MGESGAPNSSSGGILRAAVASRFGSVTAGGPGAVVYSGTDMGRIMGRVLAAAPGPRITATQSQAEAAAVPAGARVDAAANTVAFTGRTVTLTVVAGPAAQSMYTFGIAGLTDPAITVPANAQVTLRFVNADTDMAHGIVITTAGPAATRAWMPMMSAAPAFPRAALWALGEQNSSGAPTATTQFTATTAGTYTYLCRVPGHAQQGRYGTFTVR